MPAYVVAQIDVHDAERYPKYARRVPATLEPYGGRALVRGGETRTLEGSPRSRIVVVRFDTITQATAWWNSSSYREARQIRRALATADIALVEGG